MSMYGEVYPRMEGKGHGIYMLLLLKLYNVFHLTVSVVWKFFP